MGKGLSHLARGKLDNAIMFVRQLHLALGTHHAVAFDATDLAHLDRCVDAGHVGAGLGHHHGDALARVGRAADDLDLARIRLHLADLELVGIGMLFGRKHLADGEGPQLGGGVDHLFDLKPEIGQGIKDFVKRRGRVQMAFQPGKREFHGPAAG